jgi:hypothetical protein
VAEVEQEKDSFPAGEIASGFLLVDFPAESVFPGLFGFGRLSCRKVLSQDLFYSRLVTTRRATFAGMREFTVQAE